MGLEPCVRGAFVQQFVIEDSTGKFHEIGSRGIYPTGPKLLFKRPLMIGSGEYSRTIGAYIGIPVIGSVGNDSLTVKRLGQSAALHAQWLENSLV